MVMDGNQEKKRILIRFRPEIYECLQSESAYVGLRTGTFVNNILSIELDRVDKAGEGHCVALDSSEYSKIMAAGKGTEDYYIIPSSDEVISCTPLLSGRSGNKLGKGRQVSLYLTDKQVNLLNRVVYAQDIRSAFDSGEIVSYRFAVLGLLLNSHVLDKRELISR